MLFRKVTSKHPRSCLITPVVVMATRRAVTLPAAHKQLLCLEKVQITFNWGDCTRYITSVQLFSLCGVINDITRGCRAMWCCCSRYHKGVELRGAGPEFWSALADTQLDRAGSGVGVGRIHLAHDPTKTHNSSTINNQITSRSGTQWWF